MLVLLNHSRGGWTLSSYPDREPDSVIVAVEPGFRVLWQGITLKPNLVYDEYQAFWLSQEHVPNDKTDGVHQGPVSLVIREPREEDKTAVARFRILQLIKSGQLQERTLLFEAGQLAVSTGIPHACPMLPYQHSPGRRTVWDRLGVE